MTTDRDFDRRVRSWLDDGPTELSADVLESALHDVHLTRQRRPWLVQEIRVGWSKRGMRWLAAAAAVLAIAVIAAELIGVRNAPVGFRPTQAPPSAGPPNPTISTEGWTRFVSPRHGYALRHPEGWRETPGTAAWQIGAALRLGDPWIDTLAVVDPSGPIELRLTATSQAIPDGMAPEEWVRGYHDLNVRAFGEACAGGDPSTWDAVRVGDQIGLLSLGCANILEVVATAGGRGYVFDFFPAVIEPAERQLFDAILATVGFQPGDALDDLVSLAPGTYTTATFRPQVTFTVTGENWLHADATDQLLITRQESKLARAQSGDLRFYGGGDRLQILRLTGVYEPGDPPAAGPPPTDLIAWLTAHPLLSEAVRGQLQIDGLERPYLEALNEGGAVPSVSAAALRLLQTSGAPFSVHPGNRHRFIDVDAGGSRLVVVISSLPADFDATLAAYLPVVQSLRFQAGG